MTAATTGFGVLLKRGDGGVGAGTKANVEWGSSNQKIRIKWKSAGVAGNGKNITVVVSGASFVNTAIDNTQVSITAPTTATVAQTIAYLYSIAAFDQYWDADYGATPGDGSGTITARTVTATAGGTDGAEVFTTIAEVKSISGPNMRAGVTDVTNMDSASNTREFLSTLIDPGDVSFQVNLLPGNAQQTGLRSDLTNRTRRNFQLVLTSSPAVTVAFGGFVTGFDITSQMEEALLAAVTIKVTSVPVWA